MKRFLIDFNFFSNHFNLQIGGALRRQLVINKMNIVMESLSLFEFKLYQSKQLSRNHFQVEIVQHVQRDLFANLVKNKELSWSCSRHIGY